MAKRLWCWAAVVGLMGSGCSTFESGDASIMVRVRNDRAEAIQVSIGPADYGEVAPGATTDYETVGNCANDVVVDGESFASAEFCCASAGAEGFCQGHWTYVVRDSNGGFSADDFGSLTHSGSGAGEPASGAGAAGAAGSAGSAGAAGAAGSAGSAGVAGAAGSAGSAGAAGAAGSAGSAGAAGAAGSAGSAGAAGAAGSASSGGGEGGASGGAASGGGGSCTPECFRPYTCAATCQDEPFNNGCCSCPEGTIDTITCRNDDTGYCGLPCTGAAPDPGVQEECSAITIAADCDAHATNGFPATCAWIGPSTDPCLAP